tara:strand:+ start:596 stop:1213 length:618 start_codon:yes stop_codon:yes gene_type:complete
MAYKKTKTDDTKGKGAAPFAKYTKDIRTKTRNGIIKNPLKSIDPAQEIISTALKDLKTDGYTSYDTIQREITSDAETLLNDMGFVAVESEVLDPHSSITVEFDKNFSLLKTTNVDTTIKSSKILDPDLSTLTPDTILTGDKFKSASDPFYELDDEYPENIKIKRKEDMRDKKLKLVRVATKLTKTARKSRNKMLLKNPSRGGVQK